MLCIAVAKVAVSCFGWPSAHYGFLAGSLFRIGASFNRARYILVSTAFSLTPRIAATSD